MEARIEHADNARVEAEAHYNAKHTKLLELGVRWVPQSGQPLPAGS
jgi:hypothetical protein